MGLTLPGSKLKYDPSDSVLGLDISPTTIVGNSRIIAYITHDKKIEVILSSLAETEPEYVLLRDTKPTDSGYISIISIMSVLIAIKADGTAVQWGQYDLTTNTNNIGDALDISRKYVQGYSAASVSLLLTTTGEIKAFNTLEPNGITSSTNPYTGPYFTPSGTDFVKVFPVDAWNKAGALKKDGTLVFWNNAGYVTDALTAGKKYIDVNVDPLMFKKEDGSYDMYNTNLKNVLPPDGEFLDAAYVSEYHILYIDNNGIINGKYDRKGTTGTYSDYDLISNTPSSYRFSKILKLDATTEKMAGILNDGTVVVVQDPTVTSNQFNTSGRPKAFVPKKLEKKFLLSYNNKFYSIKRQPKLDYIMAMYKDSPYIVNTNGAMTAQGITIDPEFSQPIWKSIMVNSMNIVGIDGNYIAIRKDGSIKTNITHDPTCPGFESIDKDFISMDHSNYGWVFCRSDGSIKVIPTTGLGVGADEVTISTAPKTNDFVQVSYAKLQRWICGLKKDGSIVVWGDPATLGNLKNIPTGNNYKYIASSNHGFYALTKDNTIVPFGNDTYITSSYTNPIPSNKNYIKLALFDMAGMALADDGTIEFFGDKTINDIKKHTANYGFIDICSSNSASHKSYQALRIDGTRVISYNAALDPTDDVKIDTPTTIPTDYVTYNGIKYSLNNSSTNLFEVPDNSESSYKNYGVEDITLLQNVLNKSEVVSMNTLNNLF